MVKETTLESLRRDIQQDIRTGIDDVLAVVKDLAQFTSDGFERLDGRMDNLDCRMDKLDGRMDNLDGRVDKLDGRMDRLENHVESIDGTLRDHTMRFAQIQASLDDIIAKQDAHHNDIIEIYSILKKHEKQQKLSDIDLKNAEISINRIISWAQSVSKVLDIPIK